MAYNKLPKLPTWAEDVTLQPLDLTQPAAQQIKDGFVRTPTPPKRPWFNWFFNRIMSGLQYLTRRGIADWDVEESYALGDKAVSPVDGKVYQAKIPTQGEEPSVTPASWERWGFTFEEGDTRYANLNGNTLQRFEVAEARLTTEAVSLNQLNTGLNTLSKKLPVLVEHGDTSHSTGVGYIYHPSTGFTEMWGYMAPAGLTSDLFPLALDKVYHFSCTPIYYSTVPGGGAATVQLRSIVSGSGFTLVSSLEAEADDVFHADANVSVYWRVTGKRNTPPNV